MAGVAAAIEFRRAFQHQHGSTKPPCADRSTERSVAAADNQHIELAIKIDHAFLLIWLAWKAKRDRSGGYLAGCFQVYAVTASRVSMVRPPR